MPSVAISLANTATRLVSDPPAWSRSLASPDSGTRRRTRTSPVKASAGGTLTSSVASTGRVAAAKAGRRFHTLTLPLIPRSVTRTFERGPSEPWAGTPRV